MNPIFGLKFIKNKIFTFSMIIILIISKHSVAFKSKNAGKNILKLLAWMGYWCCNQKEG